MGISIGTADIKRLRKNATNDIILTQELKTLHNMFVVDIVFVTSYLLCSIDGIMWLVADPSHVIGLYPNLLPDEFRSQLAYPDRMPELEGGQLENGIFALIDYLTQVVITFSIIDFMIMIISMIGYLVSLDMVVTRYILYFSR